MENITSSAGLKSAIQSLEFEQAGNGQLLEEQFFVVIESLKPANLIKSTLHNISSSPSLIDNLLSAAIGLATGYLTKKITIGTSGNIVKKLFGSALQFGVTTVVAQHPNTIKSIGRFIFRRILRKKELNAESFDK